MSKQWHAARSKQKFGRASETLTARECILLLTLITSFLLVGFFTGFLPMGAIRLALTVL